MRPRVIIHNSMSVDGALSDFDVDLAGHYGVLGRFGAGAHLVGSRTARHGVELFGGDAPPESVTDRQRPTLQPADPRPVWVVVDSGGRLQGLLHHFRRFDRCRDVAVLATAATPAAYRTYLEERDYPYLVAGSDRVDLARGLEWLQAKHGVKTVVTDSGGELNGALLQAGLVDQVSLLVDPTLVGHDTVRLATGLTANVILHLKEHELRDDGRLRLLYDVVQEEPG